MLRPSLPFLLSVLVALIVTGCQLAPTPADFSDYQRWSAKPGNAAKAARLTQYLRREGVDQVIPIYQLLRSDVKWKMCSADQFEVPPKALWPNLVPTLRTVRDQVIPVVGPIKALSVFRSDQINSCIKGASRSFHLRFHAIDMQPSNKISRDDLIIKLCKLYREKGAALNLGVGIYVGRRFHIDTAGHRTWGSNYHSNSSPCRSNVAPQRTLR